MRYITARDADGQWRWSDNTELADSSKWRADEPDELDLQTRAAVNAYDGTWISAPRGEQYFTVCELIGQFFARVSR